MTIICVISHYTNSIMSMTVVVVVFIYVICTYTLFIHFFSPEIMWYVWYIIININTVCAMIFQTFSILTFFYSVVGKIKKLYQMTLARACYAQLYSLVHQNIRNTLTLYVDIQKYLFFPIRIITRSSDDGLDTVENHTTKMQTK